jgi:acetolactate synthase-1/2/3 large subunit
VKLAESFGCFGAYVDRSRDLAGVIEEAFASKKPAVIAIPIDYRDNDRLTEQLQIVV